MPTELLTPAEVADIFQVTVATVYGWVRNGDLPKVPLPGGGRKYRIRRADVEAFIANDAPADDWLTSARDAVR